MARPRPTVEQIDLSLNGSYAWLMVADQTHDRQPEGQTWQRHSRARGHGLNVVLEGRLSYRHPDGTASELGPGDRFQRFCGDGHATRVLAFPFREIYCYTNQATRIRLAALGAYDDTWLVRCAGDSATLVAALRQLARSIAQVRTAGCSPGLVLRRYLEVLELASDHGPGEAPRSWAAAVQQAQRLLSEHPRLPQSPQSVAGRLGVPYRQLRERFTAQVGCSMQEWRIRQRLELAKQLLAEHPVAAVAAQLGFSDAFAFSRQFRRHCGVAPSRWRV